MNRKMKYDAIFICYLQIAAIAFYCIPISCETNFDLIHREIVYIEGFKAFRKKLVKVKAPVKDLIKLQKLID